MSDALLAVAFALGFALVTFGAWLIYEPAGFIVGGLILVVVSVLYVRGSWTSSNE